MTDNGNDMVEIRRDRYLIQLKHPILIRTRMYESPCGVLMLGAAEEKLCLCDWLKEPHHRQVEYRLQRMMGAEFEEGTTEVIEQAARQLDEYFSVQRHTFDIPLMLVGTPFQQSVWQSLLTIPYGDVLSYAEVACRIGKPRAVRAVAHAIGANALSLFIPCHRIIGSNHSLMGYAGGQEAKRQLLEIEKGAYILKKCRNHLPYKLIL